jgi:hypothetical protein
MSSSPCNLCAHPVRDDGTFRVSKIKSSRQRYGNGEIYWVDKSVDDIVLEVLSQHMGDTDAAALRCLLQSNQSSQTTKTAQLESGETTKADQPERGDRGNFVKRRPCVVMQGGSDTPVICVMATFGGTRYPHLSEIIKLLALPIWPISDRLPRNFAGGHVHSSPDMKSPDVNLKNTGKLHWRYVVLYPFTYTGAMYPPRHGDPLAIRRLSREEVGKIRFAAQHAQDSIAQDRLKKPQYIQSLVEGYMVSLHSRSPNKLLTHSAHLEGGHLPQLPSVYHPSRTSRLG